uniref:Uncharacterized protein n=1 Tax=Alexandrium andersonii TaxID=327968 RepID=A0A7S2DTC7_9DINO
MMFYNSLYTNQGSRQEPHIGLTNTVPSFSSMLMINVLLWCRRQYWYPRSIIVILAAVLFSCSFCIFYGCRAHLRRRRSKLAMVCAQQVPCCPDGAMMVAETVTRCTDADDHSD